MNTRRAELQGPLDAHQTHPVLSVADRMRAAARRWRGGKGSGGGEGGREGGGRQNATPSSRKPGDRTCSLSQPHARRLSTRGSSLAAWGCRITLTTAFFFLPFFFLTHAPPPPLFCGCLIAREVVHATHGDVGGGGGRRRNILLN